MLAGHSFGGYTCGLYASQYYRYIKKLMMLSPAGVPKKPENFDMWAEIEKFPADQRPPKFAFHLVPYFWRKKISPFSIMRKAAIGPFLFKQYIKKRFRSIPETDLAAYKPYL